MTLAKPSSYRYVIETLLFLIYAAFGIAWIGVTPLMTEFQAAFGLTHAQLGLLNTSVTIAKVIAPLLTGILVSRLGSRRCIQIGAALIALAIAVPYAPSYTVLLAERFLFGMGGAMVVTLFSPMVMDWFPAGERPLVTAINNVAVNTGIAITLFATVPFAARVGWRMALTTYGAISVVLCVAWALLGRNATAGRTATVTPAATVGYRQVWAMRETWLVTLGFSGPLALYLALNTWLPAYCMESFAMTKAAAAAYTGLFNLVGIPTALIAGILVKKAGVRRPFIIGAGIVMTMAALAMITSTNPSVRYGASVALGISLFTYVAPLFTIPMELPGSSSQQVGLIMATVFSVAYAVSSLSPVVVGLLHDLTGSYWAGMAFWSVGALALVVAGLALPETGEKRRPAVVPTPVTVLS